MGTPVELHCNCLGIALSPNCLIPLKLVDDHLVLESEFAAETNGT
ncbi:hypothetical protein COLO4_03685 [Corchorus olitorius]|uniref:Uncharacterized protein n=1 Tax=Corchorus olitorius TaxID=93759 RepID=A0A1R3KXN2_9ROSI|nr:hypothetical protein COLO4_03685 [Corchorus olitorius]